MRLRRGSRESCFGLGGALAVEKDQVDGGGFRAQLAEHGGDLAAMVGAVIYQVLQHLPERLRLAARRRWSCAGPRAALPRA